MSLREVSAAAGQANNSAVAYHFGSRESLVDAILERHSTPIQERYVAQLDALERHGAVSTRAAVEIMTLPIIAKLDDADGGAAYISLCAQLSVSPTPPLVGRPVACTPQVVRLMSAMWSARAVPAELEPFRMERVAATLYTSIGMWHRLVQQGTAPGPARGVRERADRRAGRHHRAPCVGAHPGGTGQGRLRQGRLRQGRLRKSRLESSSGEAARQACGKAAKRAESLRGTRPARAHAGRAPSRFANRLATAAHGAARLWG